MKKEEKLKIVFDFIADYLSDGVVEEIKAKDKPKASEDSVVDENESLSSRSYQIMQKMDEMDKRDAEFKRIVKQAKEPLEESFKTQHEKEADYEVKLFNNAPVIPTDIMEGVEAEPMEEEPTEDEIVIDEKEQKVKDTIPNHKKRK